MGLSTKMAKVLHRQAACLVLLCCLNAASSQLQAWQRGGSITPHPKGCPAGWLWVSAQNWWHPPENSNFGHLHVESCIPHMLPIAARTTISITTMFHNLQGNLEEYNSIFQPCIPFNNGGTPLVNKSVTGTDAYYHFQKYGVSFTAENCVNTSGVLGQQGISGLVDCTWTNSRDFDPQTFLRSGNAIGYFRNRVIQRQDNNRDIRSGINFGLYVQRGAAAGGGGEAAWPDNPSRNWIAAEAWTGGVQYTFAQLNTPPRLPIGGVWRPFFELVSPCPATGCRPVTSFTITLDPSFHTGNPGSVLLAGPNTTAPGFRGNITINTSGIAAGWHRLAMLADAPFNASFTQTATLVLMVEVVGPGSPAPLPRGTPVLTHTRQMGQDLPYFKPWPESVGLTCKRYSATSWENVTSYFQFDVRFMRGLVPGLERAELVLWYRKENTAPNDTDAYAYAITDAWTPYNVTYNNPKPAKGQVLGRRTFKPTDSNNFTAVPLDPVWLFNEINGDGIASIALGLDPAVVNVNMGFASWQTHLQPFLLMYPA